jgi:hypothetical protein
MHADHLTLANLRSVMNKTWEARSKWQKLGIQLELEKTDLDAISKTNGNDTDACFTEMLSMWLKQTKFPPTWSRMIKALKSRPVGFQKLAEHIKMNSGTKQRDKLPQLPLKGTTEPDEESGEGLEFEGRLRAQTRGIIVEFNILKRKLFDTLEKYSIPKLAEYLEEYRAENLTSFNDVKEFIKSKSSFYDYEIVQYIIGVAGAAEDEQRLQQYEKHFEVYAHAKGRVVQSPSTSPMTPDSQSVSKLCIMLDSEYNDLQHDPDKRMQFQCRLCNLLKVPMSKLVCIELLTVN